MSSYTRGTNRLAGFTVFVGMVLIGLAVALGNSGCTTRQNTASTLVKTGRAPIQQIQQQDTVKTDVIAIEVKDADRKLILTESFEQPTMVVRGECPKSRVFLADGSSKKLKTKECLIWLTDAGVYYNALHDSWLVTYLTGSVIGVYHNEWYVTASLQRLRNNLRRDYDNEAYTQ